MNFLNKQAPKKSDRPALNCETLEPRLMLSTVEIIAAGTTGVEEIELEINGAVVQTFDSLGNGADSGDFQTLSYQTASSVSANDIKINFINDFYEPNQVDRNVRIDAIVIDGQRFESESPEVFSTGTWLPADGVVDGFRESEYLHTEGFFQYAASNNNGSVIQINARGNEGDEEFELIIDGQALQSFTVANTTQTFSYTASGVVSPDQIRVQFTNDLWEPGVTDRNLIVDNIIVDGTTFETESPNVYSTGTWLSADGVVAGFRQSETLHTNGYFEYGGQPTAPGSIGFTIDQISIDESAGTFNVIVFRNNGSDGAVSVDYQTNFIDTDGNDHQAISGTLNFADGSTGGQLSIQITDDDLVEPSESFSLTLSNPTGGATLGNIATQTITIDDNDEVFTGILYSDSFEGTSTWTTDPFGTDTATTGMWAAGAPTQTTSGSTILQPGSGHIGSRALVTGLAGGSSVGTYDIDDGVTTALSPEIDLPAGTEVELRLEYSLAYLSNSSADDYFSVSIVSGGTTTEIYDDHAHSFDQSTSWQPLALDISAYAGQSIQILVAAADLGSGSLVEAAVDDVVVEALANGPGTINVATTGVNIEESVGSASMILTRTEGRQGTVSVDYRTISGSAGTSDFTPQTGTVTFGDGQTEAIVSIPILEDSLEEQLESFTFEILAPSGGALIGSNNTGTVTIVDNDNSVADYLPDLIPITSTLTERLSLDTSEIPGRTLLRFSTEVANAGDGPLEIWGGSTSGDSQQVFQRIYQADGGSRDVLAGEFVYHPGHGHIHFEAFATYDLQLLNANGTVIASGGKTSFCLINIRQPLPDVTANAAVVHGRGGDDCGDIQGISAGYSDVYSASLDDQWIDVTNVADGTYELKITADPEDNILETNEANNETSITITIQNGTVVSNG